jgi:hypothetical protein
MDNSKSKYEPPQIVPVGELAEAVGAAGCVFGKGASTCTPGDGRIVSAS